MATTNFIKFCGFIVHSNPDNMTQSTFPGKILETEKKKKIIFFYFSVRPLPTLAPNPTDQSRSDSISKAPCKYLHSGFFILDLLLKLRVVHIKKN